MILVTGASGLLGASVVATAVRIGHDVVGLYHRHPVSINGARLIAADLMNRAVVEEVFDKFHPSAVIHCAAETKVDWCQEHPEEARVVNVDVTRSIAEIAARCGSNLMYVSTDAVFDGARGNYSETDRPAPANVYAHTKLEGEQAVLAVNHAAAIARVTIYGWNVQKKQSLAEWILGQLRSGSTVAGFTDVVFCPILANDLAEVLLAMVERKLTGIFHVVGSEAVSKYEFARRVAQVFQFDPEKVVPSQIAQARLKAPRSKNTSLNTAKICAQLGRPMPDVDSGLRRFAQLRAEGYVERMRGEVTGVRE